MFFAVRQDNIVGLMFLALDLQKIFFDCAYSFEVRSLLVEHFHSQLWLVAVLELNLCDVMIYITNFIYDYPITHFFTGGCVNFPGFKERLESEIRRLAPTEMEVVVRDIEDPITFAWKGGASLASDKEFRGMCVTKEEYMDGGYNVCNRKFYL